MEHDLVAGLEHFLFSHLLGISSSQLTFTPSFFGGENHQPVMKPHQIFPQLR
jgi:hypothetical protein